MIPIAAWYSDDHSETGIFLKAVDEVDALIDTVYDEAARSDQPTLIHMNVHDDPDSAEFVAGVYGNTGLLCYYSGSGPDAWYSLGDESERGEIVYYYCGTPNKFPGNIEIPLALVREAAKEFLVSGGGLPKSVTWQEEC